MASIVVIEERRGTHELLRSALIIAGHDVVVSATPFPSGRYDLALVDCSRASITQAVGAARGVASRVVLYSQLADAELEEQVKAAGALGCIAPTPSPKVLLEEVNKYLRG